MFYFAFARNATFNCTHHYHMLSLRLVTRAGVSTLSSLDCACKKHRNMRDRCHSGCTKNSRMNQQMTLELYKNILITINFIITINS